LNLDEDGRFQTDIKKIDSYRLSVQLEEDINDFTEEEKQTLRKDADLDPAGITGLLRFCMEMLSIIIFYTIKGDETRAWPIIKGTHVLDAAGLIHSDMKDGFIRAEVLEWKDFVTSAGFSPAQQAGLTKIEGKEYIVKDGDIILIKFRK
jgi:ribosome-binding ATPase YchF (GTP1/OBG family)